MLVQGNTVSCMGSIRGLKQVRKVVEECFANVHPIYNIKILMIKRELANDPTLSEEDWERFLPKFAKKNVQTKKPLTVRAVKERVDAAFDTNLSSWGNTHESAWWTQTFTFCRYTPFPPAQLPSKVDLQLESGEYFANLDANGKPIQKKKKDEDKKKQPPAAAAAAAAATSSSSAPASSEGEEVVESKKKKRKRKRDAAF